MSDSGFQAMPAPGARDLHLFDRMTGIGVGTFVSPDQWAVASRGVSVIVDIENVIVTATSAPPTPSDPTVHVEVKIQGKDAASQKYYNILSSGDITEPGLHRLILYPYGSSSGAVVSPYGSPSDKKETVEPLPATWRVQIESTGEGVTYDLSCGGSTHM